MKSCSSPPPRLLPQPSNVSRKTENDKAPLQRGAFFLRSAFERATLRSPAQSANASYTRAQCFPLNTHPSRDERSLTVRGPVRGSPRRARSFGDFVIKSREKRGFARHNPSSCPRLDIRSLSFYADLGNPKINASNRNGGDCKCNRRRFSYSLFSVFPSILPFPRGTFAHRSRPRKVPSPDLP